MGDWYFCNLSHLSHYHLKSHSVNFTCSMSSFSFIVFNNRHHEKPASDNEFNVTLLPKVAIHGLWCFHSLFIFTVLLPQETYVVPLLQDAADRMHYVPAGTTKHNVKFFFDEQLYFIPHQMQSNQHSKIKLYTIWPQFHPCSHYQLWTEGFMFLESYSSKPVWNSNHTHLSEP